MPWKGREKDNIIHKGFMTGRNWHSQISSRSVAMPREPGSTGHAYSSSATEQQPKLSVSRHFADLYATNRITSRFYACIMLIGYC